MRQKHEALFEHFSDIFLENYFFRENKHKNIFFKENEDLGLNSKKISNTTLIQPSGE